MTVDRALVMRLHDQARASRWALSVEAFAESLDAAIRHGFPGAEPSPADVRSFLEALRLEDLALACGCAAGHDAAWEFFIREHRPGLYRAAEAIDRTGGGRELADSLYADLFGLRERDGERQSLFRYFHGRSSIGSWVRAVLSQRHIDTLRARRRLDPLPDDESPAALPAPVADRDPARERFRLVLHEALHAVLAMLVPRDRLRLGCYYAQNLKLAAIGRLLGEHEATVSRHLARTRRDIRAAVEQRLRDAHGFNAATISECFNAAVDDSGVLDLTILLGAVAAGKNPAQDRS